MSSFPPTVVDLEWDANDPAKPLLAAGVGLEARRTLNVLCRGVLASNAVPKLVFTKADHRWLIEHGYPVGGDIVDVQVMAWCYDETTPLDLDWCIKHYLGYDPDKRIKRGKPVTFRLDDGTYVPLAEVPWEQMKAYNERDLLNTERLAKELERRLRDVGMWEYYELMHKPFSRVLLDMEMNGLHLDLERMELLHTKLAEQTEARAATLRHDMQLPLEFNLDSPTQLANVLFTDDFTLPAKLRPGPEVMAQVREGQWPKALPTNFEVTKIGREILHGEYQLHGLNLKPRVMSPQCERGKCSHAKGEHTPSTSSKALRVHHGEHHWVSYLCDYKLETKAMSFLTAWQEHQRDSRIYTHFNQTGTATGRLSSSNPLNLQNIPARGALGQEIRALFTPADGNVLVNGDFSQIEPRLMAHFSGDPELVQVFEYGRDLYNVTAVKIFDREDISSAERTLVKNCFLALGYGAQPPKIQKMLAEQGHRFSLAFVSDVHAGLMDLYSVYMGWKKAVTAAARQDRYVTTIAGHRRHLDFTGDNGWKAELQAPNSIIQGSAADIVQATMIETARSLPRWKMVLQVHDEIMFEVRETAMPEEMGLFQTIAEGGHGYTLRVPLVFEPKIIENWGQK